MPRGPKSPEINEDTIKLLIGLIALFLANVVSIFHDASLPSISAYYHARSLGPGQGWPRDFLVGFLFAIAAMMWAYKGWGTSELVVSKIAAIAAIGIAVFPCAYTDPVTGYKYLERIPHVHYTCAAVMFGILLYFCFKFYERASCKALRGNLEALRRKKIYLLCGIAIFVSMLLMFIDFVSKEAISKGWKAERLVFYCEWAGLFSFGVAWLTASKVIPGLANSEERLRPFN